MKIKRFSDTIVVDSADNVPTSVSPITSISSDDVTYMGHKLPAPMISISGKREISKYESLHAATTEVESSEGTSSSSNGSDNEETSEGESFEQVSFEDMRSQQALVQKSVNQIPLFQPLRKNDALRDSQKLEGVSVPTLLVPKSKYCGWNHPLPVSDERSALSNILQREEDEDGSLDFDEILLEDFVIYRPGSQTYYPWQVVTLDNILSGREGCRYLLNGVLKRGDIAQYIEAAEIDINAISIDGFEDTDVHSVQNLVYLQTFTCARRRHKARECWYRLGKPSEQYRSLHGKFLWVADLAKHVVDYLHSMSYAGNGSTVRLEDFQRDFSAKLIEWHAGDARFQGWMDEYNQSDFRIPINRHKEFVFNRAFNLRGNYLKHDLWSDIIVRHLSIADRSRAPEDTLVTPYVKHCCQSMPWNYALESKSMSQLVQMDRERQATAVGFSSTTIRCQKMAAKISETAAMLERAVESRSFSAVEPDQAVGSFAIVRIKQGECGRDSDNFSFVYIQDVSKRHRKHELKVIFIYLPSETICLDGYYPHGNELFLSDCCNCSKDLEPILLTDIVRLVGVTFGEVTDGQQGFFIRQKYLPAEDAICRAKEFDFQCPCRRRSSPHAQKEPVSGQTQKEPLSGLGLFAGCGNFDFGLETAGAVKFVAAVEIVEAALKTYAANRPEGTDGLYLDSVNPCLFKILEGSSSFPAVGSVGLISAGSPCKGFSKMNPRRGDDKGMRNCSLVASTLSYIDTYLPNYAVLENVGAMNFGVGNSCNQVIACLVGLGYQVRKMEVNARDHKSAQTRNRLFLVAAAPDLPLPPKPKPSVSAETGCTRASEVSRGLPAVDNDDLICIPYPDHIPGVRQTPMLRELIRRVPRYPKKMSFLKSMKENCQGEAQLEWYWSRKTLHAVKNHMAFTRLDPDGVIPTITTTPSPSCNFGGGRIIHWDEHRTLTLIEARRAQGFPDDFVIIGELPQQWAQVGNAVNRQVAIALGEAFAESWFSPCTVGQQKIFIDIPAPRHTSQSKESRGNLVIPAEHGDSATSWSTQAMPLARQIHKETVAVTHPRLEPIPDETRSTSDKTTEVIKTKSVPKNPYAQAMDCFGTKKFNQDEVDFLKEIFEPRKPAATKKEPETLPAKKFGDDEVGFLREILRPQKMEAHANRPGKVPIKAQTNFESLSFAQIQRREILDVERNSAGVKVPITMKAERRIEFRTKPPASPKSFKYGSAENPIELKTEVTVSKRRREAFSESDDDGEDGELKNWVGKRVRARLDG